MPRRWASSVRTNKHLIDRQSWQRVMRMPKPLLLDQDGTPSLVQGLRWSYAALAFKALYFDGEEVCFDAGSVMGLMDKQPTQMQWLEALRLAESIWHLRKERNAKRSAQSQTAPDRLLHD